MRWYRVLGIDHGNLYGSGNFQIISCNATNITVTDLGVVVAGDMYEMKLEATANASSIAWTIVTFTTNTTTSGIITSHLPGNTIFLTSKKRDVPQGVFGVAYFSPIRYTLETYN